MFIAILIGFAVVGLELLYNATWLKKHPLPRDYPLPAMMLLFRLAGGVAAYVVAHQYETGLTPEWSLAVCLVTWMSFYLIGLPLLRRFFGQQLLDRLNLSKVPRN